MSFLSLLSTLKRIFLNHRLGLKIAIADCDEKNLAHVGHELATIVGQSNVLVIPTDVSKLDQVVKLRDKVYETWGEVRNLFHFVPFFSLLFVGKSSLPSGPNRRTIVYYIAMLFTCFTYFSDLFLGSCSIGLGYCQLVVFSFPLVPSHVIYRIYHTSPTLIPIQFVMFTHLPCRSLCS